MHTTLAPAPKPPQHTPSTGAICAFLTLVAQLASSIDAMAARPTTEILDGLRELERKTSLVFTLLKASVYSIVLQQEMEWGDQAQR